MTQTSSNRAGAGDLRRIPAGEFLMGTAPAEQQQLSGVLDAAWWRAGVAAEGPPHPVEISRPFDLGTHPVTVGQFRLFVEATGYRTDGERDGTGAYRWSPDRGQWDRAADCTWRNPGFAQDDDHPVVCVSWNDAAQFCAWWSGRENRRCRLPTEAEWEYACRAGTTTAFHCGAALGSHLANFDGGSPHGGAAPGPYLRRTSKVGSFPANAFGLHDMHGNVYEWCADWLDLGYYGRSPRKDPRGPDQGAERVVRGGAWNTIAARCRSACRKGGRVDFRINRRGFRVVADVD
jgi:formylglycine-generating enzyme required for sulfatase activity